MSRLRTTLWLLALATMSVGSAMAASPRDAPEYYEAPPAETAEERDSRRIAEMEAALGRLVGRFGVERPWALSRPSPPKSASRTMLDCMAIGEGRGVHCVLLRVLSPPLPAGRAGSPGRQQQLRSSGASMASSFTQYGIDPKASKIRVMNVDRGSAVLMEGTVSGNRLTMQGRCWNMPPDCVVGQRMIASEDGESLSITEFNYNAIEGFEPGAQYTLRRLSQAEVDAVNWSVEGAPPAFPTKPGRPR